MIGRTRYHEAKLKFEDTFQFQFIQSYLYTTSLTPTQSVPTHNILAGRRPETFFTEGSKLKLVLKDPSMP